MILANLRRRTLPIYRAVGRLELPPTFLLSNNEKTGLSVNFPIVGTCQPTVACATYCYAGAGRIAMDPALARQTRNLRLAEHLVGAADAEVHAAADALAHACYRRKRDWLRWHGVGDLHFGTVRVLTALLRRHPTLVQWVVTRRADLAVWLPDVPNLVLMPSLDGSETVSRRDALRSLRRRFRHARVRYAWIARPDDRRAPPRGTFVVFNEHHGGRRSGDAVDPRVCPATAPDGLDHTGACPACRRCFA